MISSYAELGIEATCDQNEETNESALLSLFDGSDGFGSFLSSPYDNTQEGKNLDSKQDGIMGDEFLPSQLLSDLLSGSTAPTTKVSGHFKLFTQADTKPTFKFQEYFQ